MTRLPRRALAWLCPVIAVAAAVGGAVPADAQQEYILDEEDQWSAETPPDPSTPEGQLAEVRFALAEQAWARAQELATQWIDRYPRHPQIAEAYLYRGDSYRGRTEYYEALFDYEYVARVYTGSEAFVTALQRELEIAKLYASGKRRKIWGMPLIDASDEAEELLIRIQERMPGSTLGEEAGMTLADFYFKRQDMTLAAEAYSLFIQNYPRSRQLSKARRRLIYANLAAFKGPSYDASGLFEARIKLRQLIAAEPATAQQIGAEALIRRIDDSTAWKLLKVADWYEKTGNAVSAEYTISRLIREYPRTSAAKQALRQIPGILEKLPAGIREQTLDYDAYRAGVLVDETIMILEPAEALPAEAPPAEAEPQ